MVNKAGIITFHNADNLGAVLQAYALERTLVDACGVDAEIIDYRCEIIENGKFPQKPHSLKATMKWPLMFLYYGIKRRSFEKFRRRYLKLSQPYFKNTVAESADRYDLFITGSDQVWNMECSGDDTSYFLDFVPKDKAKCSYAVSLGSYKFKKSEKEQCKAMISEMKHVSVRERSTVGELEKIGIYGAEVLPDPVFLMEPELWHEIMPKKLYHGKYVFVYLILEDVNVLKSAKAYAQLHGCKIINNKKSMEFILHNSPAEFLWWIYNAECVFTNSFHATAFSLIFDRPLAADIQLKNGATNNRVNELLCHCEADRCIIKEDDPFGGYGEADAHIKVLREKGIEYLRQICRNI